MLHLTDPSTTDLDGTVDLRTFVTDNRACDGSGTVESAVVAGGTVAITDGVVNELAALLACEPFPTSGTLLRDLVARLPVAGEVRDGYNRDLFNHWVDADGDCRDTRDEVLAAESRVAVSGCNIQQGQWYSYYDGVTWTVASDVDIDHMVPLAEGWDSGARSWDADTRERFANDLDDPRSLVAVTDNVNQSKSDQDPAEWLPDRDRCRYVHEWTAVKTRWSLTVDQVEHDRLTQLASGCPDVWVTVELAPIGEGTPPPPEPEPGGCHPAYPDFCIPPPPPDLDCGDFSQSNFTVDHTYGDTHQLDGDGDGVACQG